MFVFEFIPLNKKRRCNVLRHIQNIFVTIQVGKKRGSKGLPPTGGNSRGAGFSLPGRGVSPDFLFSISPPNVHQAAKWRRERVL
jgi:hypothetical protein